MTSVCDDNFPAKEFSSQKKENIKNIQNVQREREGESIFIYIGGCGVLAWEDRTQIEGVGESQGDMTVSRVSFL